MNKKELIEVLASEAGLSKADTGRVVDAFISTISKTLESGGEVRLVGFGTFKTVKVLERTVRNPQTGAPMKLPAGRKVRFIVGGVLKSSVNKKDS